MPEYTIEELLLPASADGPDAEDFRSYVDLRNEIEIAAFGTDDRYLSAAELLPWLVDPTAPVRLFGVRVDGVLVAHSLFEEELGNPDHLWLSVQVLPEHRGRGLGTALLEHAEALAAAEGRAKIIAYAASGAGAGDRIPAPTGFGSVPALNPEVRFLLKHGYRLEQIARGSRLELPAHIDVPEPATGYRLHFWEQHTPERWREGVALLLTRMTTDAPTAGLDEPEDVWTVDRLLEFETAQATSPRRTLVVAVEHIESGTLAGYSELRVPVELSRAASQGNTLVLREHRGHRLGMLLKLANLERLQREHPGHPSVFTFNAEENRYMLDVNEAVGFVAVGYEGGWRKDL